MEFIGRITKNAVVNQLKDERKVVNFNLAVNDYFKSKDSEIKQFSTFINCSFWRNPKIADFLTAGSMVEVSGRIYVSAYTDSEGNAKASLNCHVNSIKIHSFGKKDKNNLNGNSGKVINIRKEEIKEDLPF
ncbi:MAG: single-stranded DNA-binding protein [Ginsengibacter sp.]